MKKLTAVLLSLTLALTLAVPAFAAPVDGAYTVDGQPVPIYTPGEAIPINAILPDAANDAALGVIGGADGPTAIFTTGMGAEQRDELKESLGGVPGQVGVMAGGKYVKFPDAAPEVTNDRTMVPVRALVETLGGEVDYQDDVVTFTMDGYAYEFAIGSATVKVSPTAGNDKDTPEPEDIEMDCAPYIKGGRTYVPIRFIAEALGYEVGWDSGFQTAILLDRDALAADVDKSCTIMNKVQANQGLGMEKGKNYQADVEGNVSVTLFDTINGDKTYTADLTGRQLFNTGAASASMSFKLSDNALDDLMKYLINSYASEEDVAEMREAAQLVLDALEDMELIMTKEGSVWFRMAALDELAGKDNLWLSFDLGEELGEMAFTQTGDATIGSVLADMLDQDSVVNVYSLTAAAEMMKDLFGDGKFTTSKGVSTLTIGLDELVGIYEKMGLSADDVAEAKTAFKEYEIVMKVDAKGGASVTCDMETNAQSGVPGMKITMEVTQEGGNVTENMTFHIANLGEMTLELIQTQKAAAGKPMTQPPEGAEIVDGSSFTPELLQP